MSNFATYPTNDITTEDAKAWAHALLGFNKLTGTMKHLALNSRLVDRLDYELMFIGKYRISADPTTAPQEKS